MSQIAGVAHSLLNQGVNPGRILHRVSRRVFRKLKFKPLGHQGDAGELLTQVIMKIQSNSATFSLGYFEEFRLEPFAFRDRSMELGVGYG
jgi:hypothetical protein